ncbi:unnamed protein product [Mytilus edulis]|uniref:Uncharacterized protein n=1 Tax=Mytilus edulis TaxID=6550 RepID=A0A8S3T2R3_MYTED|nr:unnamed protein product [Mytilus edulis]
MTLELQKLRAEVSTLTQKTTLLENSKLTNWERFPKLDGIIGGGYYTHKGAPANTICLPHDPDFIHGDKVQFPSEVSTMYGGEYQDNYFGNNLYQNDPPCAVCRATGKTSVVMIPGKTKCYGDWHLEYYGRLAAGRDIHEAASEYICVDHQAQYREGGGTSQDGKMLYAVVAKCGTLPCPPYPTVSAEKRLLLNDPDIVSTLQQMTLELQKLRADVSTLQQETSLLQKSKLTGSAYTRWGRKDCPVNGTELVYAGK